VSELCRKLSTADRTSLRSGTGGCCAGSVGGKCAVSKGCGTLFTAGAGIIIRCLSFTGSICCFIRIGCYLLVIGVTDSIYIFLICNITCYCTDFRPRIGMMSVFIIFWEILSPSLALLIFMFGLNIVAGLCEPFADSKIVNLYSSISRSFGYLLSIILMVSFMYVLVLILIICSTTIL